MPDYTLVTPFKDLFGTERTTLKVRDVIRARDVMAAREAGTDAFRIGIALIARMCGLDPKDVEEMDIRDVDALDALIVELRTPKAVTTSTTIAGS